MCLVWTRADQGLLPYPQRPLRTSIDDDEGAGHESVNHAFLSSTMSNDQLRFAVWGLTVSILHAACCATPPPLLRLRAGSASLRPSPDEMRLQRPLTRNLGPTRLKLGNTCSHFSSSCLFSQWRRSFVTAMPCFCFFCLTPNRSTWPSAQTPGCFPHGMFPHAADLKRQGLICPVPPCPTCLHHPHEGLC